VLVFCKEKLHKAKPQPRLAKVQHEEHDAKSISGDIVSAKPVDNKPVVLVSDKPLVVKGKDMSACDKGIENRARYLSTPEAR
jgi:hypothetical protein